MEGRDDILDWLTFLALPGPGRVLSRRLLAAFETPGRVLAAGKAVAQVQGVGRNIVDLFSSPSRLDTARFRAEKEYSRIRKKNIRLLCCDDPLYPSLLLNTHDYPLLLYCSGDIDLLNRPAVAVVGSRMPTDYGKNIATSLARQLAAQGLVVVSGLAKGIDGRSHIGALEAGGTTIAVLGCGLDVIYPGENRDLYQQIAEQGLLLSEYPLATPPQGFRFPERNRIVSGLSLGVLIVEAAVRSGALITARLALEQNREVFAVPGRIDSPKSQGTHSLLRQGATLVRSVDDILAELPPLIPFSATAACSAGNISSISSAPAHSKPEPLPDDLSADEKKVLSSLNELSTDIEQL
ncbi:MAG: DNA-protecting protein DprA, partial [Candidatus Electrothrix sp. EH2]|nr:DNA-protecting protein DprA [Candidatus Electrothrix sp. EH2]